MSDNSQEGQYRDPQADDNINPLENFLDELLTITVQFKI